MANNIKVRDKFRVLSDGNEFEVAYSAGKDNVMIKYTQSKTKPTEPFIISRETVSKWIDFGTIEKIESHT